MTVRIPAHRVVAENGLPDVCAAHGNPATVRMETRIESSPPGWVWATLPLGLLVFFILRAALRRSVTAPSWGFCRDCLVTRRNRLVTGLALLVGGVASGIAIVAFAEATSRFGWLGLVCLLLVIAGYVVLRISAGEVVARASVTRDGEFVEVRHPAPAFAAQVDAAFAASSSAGV
ncbi:hypothetical protein F4553_000284 [Allocatelliglobosispora scoriae]|uniref:Uncharacterized protein n=1 Tax=Allocatelliglobosispora scoriae TaxID=643052 RepID=A0A841BGZ8_9ACTN|nr:hypothetical protein [Allocatelliglobosispora scoriae]MBB5866905.1 hypothetical protein [Allocatelliglobosispora scoriae]